VGRPCVQSQTAQTNVRLKLPLEDYCEIKFGAGRKAYVRYVIV
jgi:hypothetical protein